MSKAGVADKSRDVTLHDHIRELRNRLFFLSIIFIASSSLAYSYKDILIDFLLKPLGDEKLIYLNPGGGFSFIFSVAMYVGAAITIPFAVYHLYRFVAPALPTSAQKHSALVLLSSLGLLIAGAAFGYIYAIPGALNFLNHFADGYINPSLTADSYLSFILAYTAGLGMLFQLPLILLFIHWVHPLKPMGLLKFERYMVLIAFIAAALITPTPDVLNQTIIALPIILMYQAGVIAVSISVYRAKKRALKHTSLKHRKVSYADQSIDMFIPDDLIPELEKNAAIASITTERPSPLLHTKIKPSIPRQASDIASARQIKSSPQLRPKPDSIAIPGRSTGSLGPRPRLRSVDGFSMRV